MPSLNDAIRGRRSVREYSSRQVPSEILNEVLEAARWAPSAHNAQPWRFIVLTDAATKAVLAKAMEEAWNADLAKEGLAATARAAMTETSTKCFTNAPALIVACLTMSNMKKYPDASRRKSERDLAVQSVGAAIQNLLLAAHSKGLGACWFSAPVFCKDAVRKVLEIPEDVEPQALIAMGYSTEKPSAPARKPFKSIVYFSRWSKES